VYKKCVMNRMSTNFTYNLVSYILEINKFFGVEGAKKAQGITIVIDIFRAATVEAFLLDKGVKEIIDRCAQELDRFNCEISVDAAREGAIINL